MEDKKNIQKKDNKDEKINALNKAKKLCSNQEKCIYDIQKKFKDWNIPEEFHDEIIKQLLDDGFINEERYANAFVNDKFRFSKWGKIKIIYALKGKKIPVTIIYKAVSTIDEKDYFSLIEKDIKNKYKSLHTSNKLEIKGKLFRFAQSKGFEADQSLQIINKLLKTEY